MCSDHLKVLQHLKRRELKDVLEVQSAVLKATHDFMYEHDVVQVMPVILSPFTDPLAHEVYDAAITYQGQRLQLTKSMILHKQLLMLRDDIKGVYVVSPNVRLELAELSSTGKHLIEFSQVDIELKETSMREFMDFIEDLYLHIFSFVKQECADSLHRLKRDLPELKRPFKVYDKTELEEQHGRDFERIISEQESQPFWIVNHWREFYDKEDVERKRHLNYDLVYPEGFGEALSGGERETAYATILRKMKERGTPTEEYALYLSIAKEGLLRPSAGAGFGVERLVRYLCGLKSVADVTPFPRVPGTKVLV
jgi:asparaginyl-tRNA synthetase